MPSPGLRVAIVGTGPAGGYALARLLETDTVDSVSMIDRLPTPGGLIRAGVAPDHPDTKRVFDGFARAMRDPRVHCHLGVEVGRDVSPEELARHHHAVIYAVGAAGARSLGIPGEETPGSHAATEFVGWYNGHPDHARHHFDLSHPRVIVIGTGNVAVDVARMLTLNPAALERTDVADHALRTLAHSAVEEVLLLGRRGPEDAAFTTPELLALTQLQDVDVVCDADDFTAVPTPSSYGGRLKLQLMDELLARVPTPGRRRIVLRFHTAPVAVLAADGRASGLRVEDRRERAARPGRRAAQETLPAGLLLRSIGYRGAPVTGLPFDAASGTMPNRGGRVEAGTYVTGWFKRGPSGVIGTNRHCAIETVGALLADAPALADPPADAFAALIADRVPAALTVDGWTRIDRHERDAGERQERPRVKLCDRAELLSAAARDTVAVG